MTVWLFAIPVVALIAAVWWLARGIARLRAEIGAAESRLARRLYTLQGRVAETDATVRELDFERRRRRGEIGFEPGTTIDEALAVHPRVREVFAAFGLTGAGCSGPGLSGSRTIAETCHRASLDTAEVLAALRRFAEDPAGPIDAHSATARLHRIAKPGRPTRIS